MNDKGSTLVLLVIVIALVIVLGTGILNVVIKQYGINKFHNDSKESFYMAETGLNEAYVRACVLIDEAIAHAAQIAKDYLIINPLNTVEAKNIFITNYKTNIISNIKNRIETTANPRVEVRNYDTLVFVNNKLSVFLKSSYINDNNVEKLVWVYLIISVPEFDDLVGGVYEADKYIEFDNWSS